MTTDRLDMRVYLNVPYPEKEEAKRCGAWWDDILKKWWIDRRAIHANPSVYRWMEKGSVVYRQAKEAFDFLRKRAGGSRPGHRSRWAKPRR
jgi:hypothetical protein